MYKHGDPVGWRIEAVDPQTGQHIEPEAELFVHLNYMGKTQDIKMRWRATATQPERTFWVAKWIVPNDAPTGIVRFTVTAKDKYGRTGEFKPFEVEASQLTIDGVSPVRAPAATAIGATLFVALSAFACGRAEPVSSQAPDASAPKSSAAPLKLLTLTYDKSRKPVPGTDVVATAEGLPANRKVTLLWGTVDGGWVIEGYSHFRGKKFSDTTKPLTQAEVDASGRLSARFAIPEDYGGVHEVLVHRRRRDALPRVGLRSARPSRYIRPKDPSARRSNCASPASAGARWRARGS